MTTVIIVLVVLVVVVVAGATITGVRTRRRRATLRSDFGHEYDHAVAGSTNRREAERDLMARRQEHEELQLRPLSEASRTRYSDEWAVVQAKFVDAPVLALSDADNLVTRLLAERGYPTDGFDDQARMLSVEHSHVIADYREAHAVELESRSGTADTESVRNALLDLRRVFESVMSTAERSSTPQPVTR